jgi:hypothetical protein
LCNCICRSFPENSVPADEEVLVEESAEVVESEDDECEEPIEKKKPATCTRQRWKDDEVFELKKYFKEFMDTKTTPRGPFIELIKRKSRMAGGLIHLRANHLIIKKISNMNHAKL